jgi:hypothetical protein
MLSWFRKKPEAVAAPAVSAAGPSGSNTDARIDAIVRSWDSTIASLLRQSDELLAKASAEHDAALASLGSDLQIFSRIWSRTQAQHRTFGEQLQEVWNTICDDLANLAPPEEVMNREGAKRDLSNCELQIQYTRAERFAMARVAEELKRRADAGDEAARGNLVGSYARYLGERAAHADWEIMQRAQARINVPRDRKDVPLAQLEELESSARRYFTTWLEVEASHAPLQQPYVAAKIERYMKDIEKTLRQYWQWRGRNGAG